MIAESSMLTFMIVCMMSMFQAKTPTIIAYISQSKHIDQSKDIDNYTVQYLIILNEKKEMLMMKNSLGWHTPAVRSNKAQSIKEALDSLAASIGLRIKDLRLAALYTHKFEGVPEHSEVSFRSHYTARLDQERTNNNTSPLDIVKTTNGTEYHWVPVKEAPGRFHFDFLRQQTEPILKHPKKVWGGTFLIKWKGNKFQGSSIIEPIYPLSD